MNKKAISIINVIERQLGYIPRIDENTEDIQRMYYVDQDGGMHFVIRRSSVDANTFENMLDRIYNSVYSSGITCLVRSRLVNSKLKGIHCYIDELKSEVTIMTVCSVLYYCTFSNSIETIMSQLLGWVYDDSFIKDNLTKEIESRVAYNKSEEEVATDNQDEINKSLFEGYRGL